MAFQGFTERPITGWGQEGYNYVFNKYYQPSLYEQEPWFDRAHNTYIDWLVSGGAPALFLFLALLASALLALYKSTATRAEKFLLLGALVGYGFQALFAFDNLFSYVLLAAVLAVAHDKSARPLPRLTDAPEVDANTLATMAVPVVLVVTVAMVWVVNVPGIEGSKALIRGAQTGAGDPAQNVASYKKATASGSFGTQEISEQVLTFAVAIAPQANIPIAVRQDAFTLALAQMQKEVARAPNDARIRLMYAQGLHAAGDQAGYAKEIDATLALTPNKQSIIFQRGVNKWQSGDKIGAAKDFQAGYELNTSFGAAAKYAAVGKIITGDVAGGKALLVQAFGTTIIDDDLMRFAYYDAKLFDDLVEVAKLRVTTVPNDAQAHFLLVQAYMLANRFAEARAEVQATIAAHPETAEAAAPLLKQLGL
jgi:Flp pilus assembly protein TadD